MRFENEKPNVSSTVDNIIETCIKERRYKNKEIQFSNLVKQNRRKRKKIQQIKLLDSDDLLEKEIIENRKKELLKSMRAF